MSNLNKNGLIGTVLFHGIVAFLLIFFGFSFPDPPPEEEGILVNFGTDISGYGYIEPAGDDTQAGETTEMQETAEEADIPQPEIKQESNQTVPTVKEVVEDVQDYEESPVKVNKPTPEELRQQELEKQQKIDQENLKIELEKKRQVEIEKQRIEQEKRDKAAKLQKMGQSAFGNKGVGSGDGSEGITEGTGNQGSLGGQPGAENYGNGGGLGNGISFGLGTRKAKGSLPLPIVNNCTVSNRIVIMVKIDVDSEGNVVSRSIDEATYQDDCIYEAVLKAAMSAKFTKSEKYRQRGWIKYIIEP